MRSGARSEVRSGRTPRRGDAGVSVSLPTDRRYLDVARLVVGGVASRLRLGYEELDDVQLAVESVLRSDLALAGEVNVEVAVADERLTVAVGPLDDLRLRRRLRADGRDGLGLGMLLHRLADRVEVVPGPYGSSLVLTKTPRV